MASLAGVGQTPRDPVADAPKRDGLDSAVDALERNWAWALAALMVIDFALLLYMGRGLSFFFDEWDFVLHDYGGGLHSLLTPHVGNISIFPVAVYKLLFHLVGLNHYAVYRLVLIALHLIAAGLLFVLASRRIPRVQALLAMALIMFLGSAWEDLLWAFQIGYMLSIVGGLAAWLLLERTDRRGDIAAVACLIVSVGSSSLGIPVMIGVAVELAWQRQWRRGWVVAIPAFLYVLWYLGYGESQVTINSLIAAPGFAQDLAAAAFGALIGRALEWGRPLAVAGIGVTFVMLARGRFVTPRLAGLIAAAVSLWIVTAAARSTISTAETGRYTYLGAVLIVLIGVELLRGIRTSPRTTVLAGAFVALFALAGTAVLRNGSQSLRANSETVTAELGALELAEARAPATYQPDPTRAPQITAGPYLHVVRAIGSTPADSAAQIADTYSASRNAADAVLLALDVPAPAPLVPGKNSLLAPAPALLALSGGVSGQRGRCVTLAPQPRGSLTAVFVLPPGGVAIHDEGNTPTSLALRRFGDVFDPLSSTVAGRSVAALSLPADSSATPWQLQVVTASRLSVCGIVP